MNTREVAKQYRLNKWTEIIRECLSTADGSYHLCGLLYHPLRRSVPPLADDLTSRLSAHHTRSMLGNGPPEYFGPTGPLG